METDVAADPAEGKNEVAAGKRAAEGPAEGEPVPKQANTDANDSTVKPDTEETKPETEVRLEEEAPLAGDDNGNAATDADGKQESDDSKPDVDSKAAMAGTSNASVFPLKLGPCTFESLESALAYFRGLLRVWPENVPLNEYEHLVLSDLLRKCHPRPRSKIGPGIVAFKVKANFEHTSTCFFACHKGGTEVDFSYLKCFSNLVGYNLKPGKGGGRNKQKTGRGDRGGRGRGRGLRGRGRRGRGRGRN